MEASKSEGFNIYKESTRSTPLGANVQQHFREGTLPFKRQGRVVLAAATDTHTKRCDGPPHGFEVRKAKRGPAFDALWEACLLTGSWVARRRDKRGHQIEDHKLKNGTQNKHYTDGRCSALARPLMPKKRSLFEDRKTRLGHSTCDPKGQLHG